MFAADCKRTGQKNTYKLNLQIFQIPRNDTNRRPNGLSEFYELIQTSIILKHSLMLTYSFMGRSMN